MSLKKLSRNFCLESTTKYFDLFRKFPQHFNYHATPNHDQRKSTYSFSFPYNPCIPCIPYLFIWSYFMYVNKIANPFVGGDPFFLQNNELLRRTVSALLFAFQMQLCNWLSCEQMD